MAMPEARSLQSLISSGEHYFVPVYQRAFSWRKAELSQLVRDINDVCHFDEPYYLGSLVLYLRSDGRYEVIDGQQRLTAISILLSVFRNVYLLEEGRLNIEYEVRAEAEKARDELWEGRVGDDLFSVAYRTIRSLLEEVEDIPLFFRFLLEKVNLLCIELPQDTDLNLYFEAMNRHTVQISRSDILRSHCLSILKEGRNRKLFRIIWDSCSHFDRYVEEGMSFKLWNRIYYGEAHSPLFSVPYEDWYKMITGYLGEDEESEVSTLSEIIRYESVKGGRAVKEDRMTSDVHYSITDFPDFLLIVMATLGEVHPLDDKCMLSSLLSSPWFSAEEKIMEFCYHLIRERYLFDRYVIKESEKGSYAMLQYLDLHEYRPSFKDEDICHQCEKILLSFNQRHPGPGHLDYLIPILSFLECNPDPDGERYLEFLRNLEKGDI